MSNKIYPCVWFDKLGSEAATLYTKAFDNTSINTDNGMVQMVSLDGNDIMLLNGGTHFKPNPSISLFVNFTDETAIDKAWNTLSDGGFAMMPLNKYPWSEKYGWLADKYGVSWQLMLVKPEAFEQTLIPALMFTKSMAGKAEEAMNFYTSLIPNSSVNAVNRYEKGEGDVEGTVKHGRFLLNGKLFVAMDSSAPHAFSFDEGMSIVVNCDSQDEIDKYWNSLTANGGQESQCGWLKDKYGVSWQIVPANIGQLIGNPVNGQKAMQALMKMKKIEIDKLVNA